MKYAVISLVSMPMGFFLQVESDLSKSTTWGIIVVLAGVISTLAIVYYKREKEREKMFQKIYEDHKNEIAMLTRTTTQALTETTNSIDANTEMTKETTKLIRELRDMLIKGGHSK